MATTTSQSTSLHVERSIEIAADLEKVFASLLEQLGPSSQMLDGTPMPMRLEAWPGGRWFRDLGNDSGHFWGTVQVIKPPTLIEINGPLFMSYPAVSHLQYRLIEGGDNATTVQFTHRAFGELDPEHAEAVADGWQFQMEQVKKRAEK